MKPQGNVYAFEDNCVWSCCWSFCQLWQEYMWSSVNLLKSNPKIFDPTKRHDASLNLFDINGTLACSLQKCLGPLNTLLSKGCSETGVLRHSKNHIFRSQQLRTDWSSEGDLFSNILKMLCRFRKCSKTSTKCWWFWR